MNRILPAVGLLLMASMALPMSAHRLKPLSTARRPVFPKGALCVDLWPVPRPSLLGFGPSALL